MPCMMLISARPTGLNEEGLKKYAAEGPPMIKRYGGRFVTPYSTTEVLEGSWPGEYVIMVEWESREAAMAWWEAKEYRDLRAHRVGAIDAQVVLFDVRGPKPQS